jgi:uncharacterized protein (TIGR03067 family)
LKRHSSIILISVCAIAAVGFGDTGEDGTTKLDGTWVVQSVLRNPREGNSGEGKGLRIFISGGTVVAKLPDNDKRVGTATIKCDPKQDPEALDILTDGDNVTVPAIYEVVDNALRVCVSAPGKGRPTEFASKPGSGHTLVVLMKAKP